MGWVSGQLGLVDGLFMRSFSAFLIKASLFFFRQSEAPGLLVVFLFRRIRVSLFLQKERCDWAGSPPRLFWPFGGFSVSPNKGAFIFAGSEGQVGGR